MSSIFWKAISNNERHAAISKIQHIITRYGDIVDAKLFSDISLNLKIEVEESKIDRLYDELNSVKAMEKFENINSTATRERTVYLNITFIKGSGNLAVEVPAVPG